MTTTSERVPLTLEQAMDRLDVRDGKVHAFSSPGSGMLIGTDWDVSDVRAYLDEHGAEEAGRGATTMGHGVFSGEKFFATKTVE